MLAAPSNSKIILDFMVYFYRLEYLYAQTSQHLYYQTTYLYLLMEDAEHEEHTAFAHTLQWCCLVSLPNPTKHTWHIYCFLYWSLSINFIPGIFKFTTFLLLPGPNTDSTILNDPSIDLVREFRGFYSISLLRWSSAILVYNYYIIYSHLCIVSIFRIVKL